MKLKQILQLSEQMIVAQVTHYIGYLTNIKTQHTEEHVQRIAEHLVNSFNLTKMMILRNGKIQYRTNQQVDPTAPKEIAMEIKENIDPKNSPRFDLVIRKIPKSRHCSDRSYIQCYFDTELYSQNVKNGRDPDDITEKTTFNKFIL